MQGVFPAGVYAVHAFLSVDGSVMINLLFMLFMLLNCITLGLYSIQMSYELDNHREILFKFIYLHKFSNKYQISTKIV